MKVCLYNCCCEERGHGSSGHIVRIPESPPLLLPALGISRQRWSEERTARAEGGWWREETEASLGPGPAARAPQRGSWSLGGDTKPLGCSRWNCYQLWSDLESQSLSATVSLQVPLPPSTPPEDNEPSDGEGMGCHCALWHLPENSWLNALHPVWMTLLWGHCRLMGLWNSVISLREFLTTGPRHSSETLLKVSVSLPSTLHIGSKLTRHPSSSCQMSSSQRGLPWPPSLTHEVFPCSPSLSLTVLLVYLCCLLV